MKHTNLYNNVRMPLLGIGTFMISPEDTEKSVYEALKLGYRLIDTANAYLNEKEVGNALRKAISEGIVTREEVFVSTKLWATLYENEAHPYCTEGEVMKRLYEYGTKLMGWYPLGHGDPELIKEAIFTKLADKYHKSNAQIVLHWHIQMGFITIPGSKNPDHIRNNADIFDFTLTEEEMAEIAKLDGTKKYYNSDNETEDKYATMHLPFETDVN